MEIVVATANLGKLREIAALLEGLPVTLSAQSAHGVLPVAEDGDTFVANALLKARHAAAATGLPVIADDSGLEVAALGGRPGVYSARFAGPNADDAANRARLLAELAALDEAGEAGDEHGAPAACFRCVAVLLPTAGAAPCIAEGVWHGRIQRQPRGTGGFGYDPVFYVPEYDCTAAQLDLDIKNTLSHRGQALRALQPQLHALLRA